MPPPTLCLPGTGGGGGGGWGRRFISFTFPFRVCLSHGTLTHLQLLVFLSNFSASAPFRGLSFLSFPAACSSSFPPLSVYCCCGNTAVWAREQIKYPRVIMHYDHRNIQVKSWSPCAIYQVNADLKLRFRYYKHQNTDISRLIAIECYHQF